MNTSPQRSHEVATAPDCVNLAISNDGVARLTMSQPQRRNALSEAMMAALQAAFDAAADDPAVRVVVLAGDGPAFCAGHDLKELTAARDSADGGRAYYTDIMGRCSRLMQTIVRHPRPVIADVRGTATAAGCQLVASCDLALASADVKFATPGVNIGLFCSTPMVALSRNVSAKHAMEMLLTGEMIPADEAARIGLINRAVPAHEMDGAVAELAGKITAKSAMTLKIGKEAFYRQAELDLADAYEYAARVMVDNMMKEDAKEGIGAFIDKRAPQWRDQ